MFPKKGPIGPFLILMAIDNLQLPMLQL